MAKCRGKQPKIAAAPAVTKTVPAWALAPLYEGRRLSWSFSAVDNDGPWAWSNLSPGRFPEVIQKLGQFETLNQQSIQNFRSIIPIAHLGKLARDRLSEINRDDLDRLVGFHIQGRERVWCAEHDGVMFVLWWDPMHTVYVVTKKHT